MTMHEIELDQIDGLQIIEIETVRSKEPETILVFEQMGEDYNLYKVVDQPQSCRDVSVGRVTVLFQNGEEYKPSEASDGLTVWEQVKNYLLPLKPVLGHA